MLRALFPKPVCAEECIVRRRSLRARDPSPSGPTPVRDTELPSVAASVGSPDRPTAGVARSRPASVANGQKAIIRVPRHALGPGAGIVVPFGNHGTPIGQKIRNPNGLKRCARHLMEIENQPASGNPGVAFGAIGAKQRLHSQSVSLQGVEGHDAAVGQRPVK